MADAFAGILNAAGFDPFLQGRGSVLQLTAPAGMVDGAGRNNPLRMG